MLKCKFIFILILAVKVLFAQPICINNIWHQGEGTFYGGVAGGQGQCQIKVPLGDTMHCAINGSDYSVTGVPCGGCIRVLGPKGEVKLRIVDVCNECKTGDIDMTPAAFKMLAKDRDGRIPISWQYVPCNTSNNISIQYELGSSQWFTLFSVANTKYPIRSVEFKDTNGQFVPIPRTLNNLFRYEQGIDRIKNEVRGIAGPYVFKIKSVLGDSVVTGNTPFIEGGTAYTDVQFEQICPDCYGVNNGTAAIDNCGVCSGGNTGILPNSNCRKDCEGYWNGTAYIDQCGTCVAGKTGRTPCGADCFGILGGQAYFDNCNQCVGGLTLKSPCTKDCHNEWGGTAFIDSCNRCAGGLTKILPSYDKANCIVSHLEGNAINLDLNVYPNPNQGNFKVLLAENHSAKLEVYNSLGQMVYQGNHKGTTDLQLIGLSKGVYIFKVKAGDMVNSQKIIIE